MILVYPIAVATLVLSGLRSSTFLDEIAKLLPASRFTSQLSSLKSHVGMGQVIRYPKIMDG